jgi:hypothetical protein
MPYTTPSASDLTDRYPEFATAPTPRIEYWITDALRTVTTSWVESDYQPAILAYAAHRLKLEGLGTSGGGAVGELGAMGVTDFKSASMSVSFDAETVRRAGDGEWSSTRYGAEFKGFLRRNNGMPRLVGCRG